MCGCAPFRSMRTTCGPAYSGCVRLVTPAACPAMNTGSPGGADASSSVPRGIFFSRSISSPTRCRAPRAAAPARRGRSQRRAPAARRAARALVSYELIALQVGVPGQPVLVQPEQAARLVERRALGAQRHFHSAPEPRHQLVLGVADVLE